MPMHELDRILARNLEQLTSRDVRRARRGRRLEADHRLRVLVANLLAARAETGMTQQDVAARMPSTKSVVSRVEGGEHTRPTLTTFEKYARAVCATIEIRARTRR